MRILKNANEHLQSVNKTANQDNWRAKVENCNSQRQVPFPPGARLLLTEAAAVGPTVLIRTGGARNVVEDSLLRSSPLPLIVVRRIGPPLTTGAVRGLSTLVFGSESLSLLTIRLA